MSKEGIEEIKYEPEEGETASDTADKKIKKIKEKLKTAEQERADYLKGLQRARADYINLERRTAKEKEEWIEFSNLDFVMDLLPTLDSLEKAMEHFKNSPDLQDSAEQDGIERIYKQFKSILEKKGVEEIKSVGEKFDPEYHESVGVVEGGESGIVIEEVQKGYCLHGKVIRPSKVKIGK